MKNVVRQLCTAQISNDKTMAKQAENDCPKIKMILQHAQTTEERQREKEKRIEAMINWNKIKKK